MKDSFELAQQRSLNAAGDYNREMGPLLSTAWQSFMFESPSGADDIVAFHYLMTYGELSGRVRTSTTEFDNVYHEWVGAYSHIRNILSYGASHEKDGLYLEDNQNMATKEPWLLRVKQGKTTSGKELFIIGQIQADPKSQNIGEASKAYLYQLVSPKVNGQGWLWLEKVYGQSHPHFSRVSMAPTEYADNQSDIKDSNDPKVQASELLERLTAINRGEAPSLDDLPATRSSVGQGLISTIFRRS